MPLIPDAAVVQSNLTSLPFFDLSAGGDRARHRFSDGKNALLYVAAILARRLDGANAALLEVKRQLDTGKLTI